MRTLSGGNQQKALIARWHLADADVFVLIEPTRGVDVGARADIYRRLDALARAGKAIVVVSSDLPEVLALADRILVVRDGAIVAETTPADARRGAAEPDDPGRGSGMIAGARPGPTANGGCPRAGGSAGAERDAGRGGAACRSSSPRPRRSSARSGNAENILRQSRLGAGARPRHDARRAGRRHRSLGRLGRARLGDARRHRARRRAAPAVAMLAAVGIGAGGRRCSTRRWSRGSGSAR